MPDTCISHPESDGSRKPLYLCAVCEWMYVSRQNNEGFVSLEFAELRNTAVAVGDGKREAA